MLENNIPKNTAGKQEKCLFPVIYKIHKLSNNT